MQATFRERRSGLRWLWQQLPTLAPIELTAAPTEVEMPMRHRTALGRLLGLCRPYRRWMAGGALCLIIAGGLGLVLPWVVRGLIDSALTSGNLAGLWQALVALVAIAVAQALFTFG